MADRCRFDLTHDLGYSYPDFAEGGEPAGEALARICRDELERRYAGSASLHEARARLAEELRLIERHGLAGFFLLHRDILEMARDVAVRCRGRSAGRHLLPPGRGRGSSVGSIVCYLIGLSHVDPIAARLFLGRFLSEELSSVPDIDLDFPRDVREGLMLAVVERYGPEHAALVAAFPTYRVRGAIRDLGKALALPMGEVERMARLADEWGAIGQEQVEQMRERAGSPRWRAFAFLMEEIMGIPRHISQHSGGMVISTRPLVELVPVIPAAMEGRQICQWDKDSCADAGFLKIDLLGLGMLSAVEECVDLIAAVRGAPIDLSRVGFDDPAVYAEIQQADTVGVFQIESRAQMQSLHQTLPENLDDLTVQVALVRPGPIVGDAVNPYVKHRRARRADPDFEPPYDHPLLEPVLARHPGGGRVPGSGARGGDRARRVLDRRGREPAPGDEPQAQPRRPRAPPAAVLHRRGRARACPRRPPSRSSRRWWPSRSSASPRATPPPSPSWPTSRRGCTAATPPSSCARS